jgi:hypothetical protein
MTEVRTAPDGSFILMDVLSFLLLMVFWRMRLAANTP